MHLFRLICSGNSGESFIIGVLERNYIGSYQIAYPVEFNRQKDGSLTHIGACNLSNLNNRIERYSINIDSIKILYDIGGDFIPHDIKQFYIDYIKKQYDANYYDEKELTFSGNFDSIDFES